MCNVLSIFVLSFIIFDIIQFLLPQLYYCDFQYFHVIIGYIIRICMGLARRTCILSLTIFEIVHFVISQLYYCN